MDGVHIHKKKESMYLIKSLNPCCNGWCTHTSNQLVLDKAGKS